jgi:dTDP-4-dehydrorhamnose reductase
MPRWFVTGAGGQLATAFENVLDGEVFLSAETALDIRDADAVREAIRGFAPDVVLHTAAYTDVDGAETDAAAAAAVNVDGTRNVVDAARRVRAIVVYFSTDYVFDGTKRTPYVETDAPRPLGEYGRTKLRGEGIVLDHAHGIVVRTSWLYSCMGRNFVKTILEAADRNAPNRETLRIVDDQVGSPTSADHLATAVLEALEGGLDAGIYHIAGGGYCSWCELAREIVALAGADVDVRPITTAELGRPAPRPAFSALTSERPVPRLPHWIDGVAEVVDRLRRLG